MELAKSRLDRLMESLTILSNVDLRAIGEAELRRLVWEETRHEVRRNSMLLNANQIWHRGRVCDPANPFESLADLMYPRNGSGRVGRAHMVGEQPVLYASRNAATVMAEIGGTSPIHIQLIATRVKPGLVCKCDVVGDFRQVNNSGLSLCGHQGSVDTISKINQDNPEEYCCSLMFDSFVALRFERRVDTTNEHEFRLTSLLASVLMARGRACALMYPSVQFGGGMNIAVPSAAFDDLFEVVWSTVVRAHPIGFGHWIPEVIRTSESIDSEGRIHWSENRSMSPKDFVFKSIAAGYRHRD